MTLNLSNKDVLIDDYIGGGKGRRIMQEIIKKVPNKKNFVILDLGFIQKSVFRQLRGKKYDLLFSIESGGGYFFEKLYAPKRVSDRISKKIISLPLSVHYPQYDFPFLSEETLSTDSNWEVSHFDADNSRFLQVK